MSSVSNQSSDSNTDERGYELPGDYSFYFGAPDQTMEDAERILREALAPIEFDVPKRADDVILIAFRDQVAAVLNTRNPTLSEHRMFGDYAIPIPYEDYKFAFGTLDELESPEEVQVFRNVARKVQQIVGNVMLVGEDQDGMGEVIEL
jgi:hypothetical protein